MIESQDSTSVKLSHTKSTLGVLGLAGKLMSSSFQWIYVQPNIPYSLVRVEGIKCYITVLDPVGFCNCVEIGVQVVHASFHSYITLG